MDKVDLTKLKAVIDRTRTSEEHQKRIEDWNRYLLEFTGKWWDSKNLSPLDSKVFVNFIFSTIQSTVPLLTDNKPKWSLLARQPFFQQIANVYNKALDYVWFRTECDRKVYQWAIDAYLWGKGLLKVYFDPDLEDGLGDIRIDPVDPRVFVVPKGYSDLWDMPWCGTVDERPVTLLRRLYPDKADKIKPSTDTENRIVRLDDFEDNVETTLVYEFWIRDGATETVTIDEDADPAGSGEKRTRKEERPIYPNGRIVVFLDDGTVLDDRPSPFRHGRPPYVALTDYEIPHEFWGMGEAAQIEDLNREFNIRLQQLVEHVRKYTKITYILDDTAQIKAEEAKQALLEGDSVLISQNGTKDVLTPVEYPRLPPGVIEILSLLPGFIEEVTGVTDVSKGQISKKQRQSASELSILIESSYTRTRQKVRNLEWAIKRLALLIVELMQQFYVEPRTFSYTEDDQVGHFTFGNSAAQIKHIAYPGDEVMGLEPEDMTAEERQAIEDYRKIVEYIGDDDEVHFGMDIEIHTNSTLPIDKQSLANLMLRLKEMDVVDAQAVLETLNVPGVNRIIARLKEVQAKREELLKQRQASGGGVMPLRTEHAPVADLEDMARGASQQGVPA